MMRRTIASSPKTKGTLMRVDVELENGYLPDAYGKYAAEEDKHGWSCRRSFPITVEDIPRDAEALALVFLDWDSVPVCGFPWIHWTAVIRGPFEDALEIPDDASRKCPCRLVQGYNSAAKSEPARGVGYVGPCPPDADHAYTLKVFALDEEPDLDGPFWANELMRECREHAIDEADAILPSRC